MGKCNKILIFAIAAALAMNLYTIPCTAEASGNHYKGADESEMKVLQSDYALKLGTINPTNSIYPNVVVDLPRAGESKTIDLQINHSLYPNAILFAYTYGGKPGDCTINVAKENGGEVSSTVINTTATDGSSSFMNKNIVTINSTEKKVRNYKVTVSTQNGKAACALNLGTEAAFAENFGGRKNITSIVKNQSYGIGTTFFKGRSALLNGKGEWFQYTADGKTYISVSIRNHDSLAFEVYDDDGRRVAQTSARDRIMEVHSSNLYTGYVHKALDLEAGQTYDIKIYSTSHIAVKNLEETYNIAIGLPFVSRESSGIKSSDSFSLPANKMKTFTITVNQPKSDRLAKGGEVCFIAPTVADSQSITYCDIIAPNGKILSAANGVYRNNTDVDFENYFDSSDNIPLNGTWTVMVKSSEPLSGLRFYIRGNYYHVYGNDIN